MLVYLVSGMVFARALTVADYGTYLQTFLAYDFATPLLTLGLPSALFYFLPGAKERQKGLVLENILLLFSQTLQGASNGRGCGVQRGRPSKVARAGYSCGQNFTSVVSRGSPPCPLSTGGTRVHLRCTVNRS